MKRRYPKGAFYRAKNKLPLHPVDPSVIRTRECGIGEGAVRHGACLARPDWSILRFQWRPFFSCWFLHEPWLILLGMGLLFNAVVG